MKPLFSILIPSIPSRMEWALPPLYRELQSQADALGNFAPLVEILALIDNKRRSIGLKRDALVQAASGEYLAFVDDDDRVEPDYVRSIVKTLRDERPDVLVFKQSTTIDGGNPFIVDFSIRYENQEARQVDGRWVNIRRKPFHVCVWRSAIAKAHRFPDASYGEDWHWAARVLADVKTQSRIDRVLHHYRFDQKVTEAEATFPRE